MNCVYYAVDYSNSLSHHGIKGQKWGVRRFQNPDGTWTEEGRKRRYRKQNAISTGVGVAAGGTIGAISVLSGHPAGILGGGLAGISAKNNVRDMQRATEAYAYNSNNPYKPVGMSVRQTKKWNKKAIRNPDYLTALKDMSQWMPETAKAYSADNNEYYDIVKTANSKQLQKFMEDTYGDSPEQMTNHLKNSVRGLNESSESSYSGELFQEPIYNNATNAYAKGFIDLKTFNDFYDSAVTNRLTNILTEYDVSQPHYREDLKAIIDEGDRLYSQNKKNGVGRLDNWFSEDPDMNPEKKLKHFFYSVNELYA